ncbi:MAG: hypothetical protein V9E94_04795 [Microthrixaceae bacterium]
MLLTTTDRWRPQDARRAAVAARTRGDLARVLTEDPEVVVGVDRPARSAVTRPRSPARSPRTVAERGTGPPTADRAADTVPGSDPGLGSPTVPGDAAGPRHRRAAPWAAPR